MTRHLIFDQVLDVVEEDESTTTSKGSNKKKAGKSPQNSIKEAVTERKNTAESMDRPPRSKSPGLSMKAQLAAKNGN
jgi:hypothetical protein